MIKYTHKYEDYDGNEVTEDLYFNLRRDELAENLHIVADFERMEKIVQEERRQLKPEEVKLMFGLIKELMRLAYGVRAGEDNRRFKKAHEHEDIWYNFYEAKVYESFIFWLFEDAERANDFAAKLMPAELRGEAIKIAQEQGVDIEAYLPPAPGDAKPEQKADNGQKPKRKEPTQEELLAMWREKEENR